MGDKTKIEWANASWNPVAGCSKEPASPGCQNCYACVMANRMGGKGQHFEGLATSDSGLHWTGEVGFYRNILTKPLHWTKPRQIFVGSMGDLFYSEVPEWMIDEVFGVIAACALHEARDHRFLLLTKRPDRLHDYITTNGVMDRWAACAGNLMEDGDGYLDQVPRLPFPLENVWIGTSTENQEQFDKRVPDIMMCPAAGRFISVEPMLERISIQHKPDGCNCVVCGDTDHQLWECHHSMRRTLDLVICGGESGPHARPLHPDWVRDLRDQCAWPEEHLIGRGPIPFMFKQWGTWAPVDWYSQATHAVRASDGYVVKMDHEPQSVSRAKKVPSEWQGIVRTGKHAAGRELDGREHLDTPWSS